jgi:hypothetical protein
VTSLSVGVAAFLPCLLATAMLVGVESRRRTTALPDRSEWHAAGQSTLRAVRRALDNERPRTRSDALRDLAWIVFGPALAVRLMIHVGAAVAIRGGDPGDLDGRRVIASPVVDVDALEELRLRIATSCYAGFWLLFGTTNMQPAGRIYFAVQLTILLIDPCLGPGARVLSHIKTMIHKTSQRMMEEQHGVR